MRGASSLAGDALPHTDPDSASQGHPSAGLGSASAPCLHTALPVPATVGPLWPAAQNPCPPGDADTLFLLPQPSTIRTVAGHPPPRPPRAHSMAEISVLIPVSHWEGADNCLPRMREGNAALMPISKVNMIQRAPAQKCWLTGSLSERGVLWTLTDFFRIVMTWRRWISKNASW